MVGKRDKFTEAHNDYYPLLFSAVYTKVGDSDDAMDICQEIFIKFFEKIDEIENYRKWLYGAMRIAVMEFYRIKRSDEVDIDDAEEEDITPERHLVPHLRKMDLQIGNPHDEEGNHHDDEELPSPLLPFGLCLFVHGSTLKV